jgi:chemotaxis response regulator CheB
MVGMASDRDIIVIGGSAGAVAGITSILSALPVDFPAALFIALHRGPRPGDTLTEVLRRRSTLPVHTAVDAACFEFGHAYLASPDHHLIVANGILHLEHSPKEQNFRPCIDVLFKSAALVYGRRVVGVLLSGGWGQDGTAGLWQIKNRGGITIVQHPHDAAHSRMAWSAIDQVHIDDVLAARDIGVRLIELCSRQARAADSRGRHRILIVEDESIVAANLHQSLSEMGYEPLDWVASGEAAIAIATHERPDVILMDIRLAGALNGIEAARRIWQTQQIPVVYCTAYGDVDTLQAVQTTESYGYLVKPFQSSAVRAAIELATGRREKELRHLGRH